MFKTRSLNIICYLKNAILTFFYDEKRFCVKFKREFLFSKW
jgi:hypothetical protein